MTRKPVKRHSTVIALAPMLGALLVLVLLALAFRNLAPIVEAFGDLTDATAVEEAR